jgi:hypothetical protein
MYPKSKSASNSTFMAACWTLNNTHKFCRQKTTFSGQLQLGRICNSPEHHILIIPMWFKEFNQIRLTHVNVRTSINVNQHMEWYFAILSKIQFHATLADGPWQPQIIHYKGGSMITWQSVNETTWQTCIICFVTYQNRVVDFAVLQWSLSYAEEPPTCRVGAHAMVESV